MNASSYKLNASGFAPACPICGADMVLKKNKNRNIEFWGCSNFKYTGCLSSCDYDTGAWIIEDGLRKAKRGISSRVKSQEEVMEIKTLIFSNVRYAKSIFNNEDLVARWLKTPSNALSGASPISLMKSLVGNCMVKELLGAISQRRHTIEKIKDS